ncbi:molybdopterin synthase sulfur carrier subunit [Microbulbifer celer]|uniref:Molybdopterin synthase sulfur carrier subunit n=1 Tax=Microbulbifer celer TaxID=435905 RepID=A0ABW3U804_9GAMM|nr:molybdopterin synthase sulfur carrier subunit [Microbulbifer celer]UFN57750.1 molybdopterin synthase sulfur carrier subunit [Microbulbifer celer]
MIKVLFFASLREQLDCDALEVAVDGLSTVGDLRQQLAGKGAVWQTALADERLQVALNQQLSSADAVVSDGDEVAFFPPVTGG